MSLLLLGRWDHGGNLRVEEYLEVDEGDPKTIQELVDAQDNTDHMAWAATFDTDYFSDALHLAYRQYVDTAQTRLERLNGPAVINATEGDQ